MVRVGIRSIPIIVLVQTFIGIILRCRWGPTLKATDRLSGSRTSSASLFRELGRCPGIVGFVERARGRVGHDGRAEIKPSRLRAQSGAVPGHAAFIATVTMLTMLIVIADVVGLFGGFITATTVLNISPDRYIAATRAAVIPKDFLSGLSKARSSAC
jgi:phospholipid/cholesterol/gamma-HCH transport system permease protein